MLSKLKEAARRHLKRKLGVADIPLALERIRANQFFPKSIFDVGAHSGEFARLCRSTWPSSRITCFEVLPHRVDQLNNWCSADGNSLVIPSLLGAESKASVPFHEMETASSVLEEHIAQSAPVRPYPMQTIDEIIESGRASVPDFLKLDVQGYELEVLKGAEKCLPRISMILAEVNLIDIHVGAPLLDHMIAFMQDHDFVAYDICGLTRRPLDQALWQADIIFVPRQSSLRSDKRWQT